MNISKWTAFWKKKDSWPTKSFMELRPPFSKFKSISYVKLMINMLCFSSSWFFLRPFTTLITTILLWHLESTVVKAEPLNGPPLIYHAKAKLLVLKMISHFQSSIWRSSRLCARPFIFHHLCFTCCKYCSPSWPILTTLNFNFHLKLITLQRKLSLVSVFNFVFQI